MEYQLLEAIAGSTQVSWLLWAFQQKCFLNKQLNVILNILESYTLSEQFGGVFLEKWRRLMIGFLMEYSGKAAGRE